MIGVLGGTFDPIHFGHLNPARDLLDTAGFEEIRFMPSAVPPHRDSPVASVPQRLAMVRLAIRDEPGFSVETCEIERPGPSYMVDSLGVIRSGLDQATPLVLILGQDAFSGLPGWHQWQSLTEHAHLLVTERPGYERVLTSELSHWLASRELGNIQALKASPSGGVFFVQQALVDISSTMIRDRVRNGQTIEGLVPEAVNDYILNEGLYRAS
jgi:nicotinate-nucleotide adenylyltransferase